MRIASAAVVALGLWAASPAQAQWEPPPPQPEQPPPPQPQPTYVPPPQPTQQPAPQPTKPAPQPEFVAPPSQPATKLSGELGAGIGGLFDDRSSHFLLFFDAKEQLYLPVWYGGWLSFREWLYADRYIPYNFGGEAQFALGPRPFRFIVLRVLAEHDQSLSLFFRGEAGTIPSFEGDIDFSDSFVLTYHVIPLQFMATRYDSKIKTNLANAGVPSADIDRRFDDLHPTVGFQFAAAFRARVTAHIKPYPNLHVKLHAEYGRQWSTLDDQIVRLQGLVGYGILEDAVVFSVRIRYDLQWVPVVDLPPPSALYSVIMASLRF